MTMNNLNKENVSDKLMALFSGCGYRQYKMSKFEEYGLYAENKSFLPSKSIITFTDTDGRLMALKPDVTLSIVKNSRDGEEYKLYYNESVYRTDRNTNNFAEITQTGLEYIGSLDTARLSEVLTIAQLSLDEISSDTVLDISHLGILSSLLDYLNVSGKDRKALLSYIENKNCHEAVKLCKDSGADDNGCKLLYDFMTLDPSPDKACEILKIYNVSDSFTKEVADFSAVLSSLDKSKLRVDFSVLNDTNYYNGIVFRGYVKGVPSAVLSGGQYDMLMRRMGKKSSAVGFAVYLDRLDDLCAKNAYPIYDVCILYDDKTDPSKLCEIIRKTVSDGMTYTAQKSAENVKYGKLCDLRCDK